MPCIVRNMTGDEAILTMKDDNLRRQMRILPTKQAAALKQQVEAKNSEIVDIVRGTNIPLAELPVMLQQVQAGATLR